MDISDESACVVQLGGRSLRVGTSPMATSHTRVCNRMLSEVDGRRLVIKPNWKGRVLGLGLMMVFSAWIAGAVFAIRFWPREPAWQFWPAVAAWGFGILLGSLLWIGGLSFLLASSAFHFDQTTGELTHGSRWSRRRRRLASILAVQLLRTQAGRPDPRHGSLHRPLYELNLVLDDPTTPRLNLSCHGDLPWTADAAKKLADLLGVPILDLVHGATGEHALAATDGPRPSVAGIGEVETSPLPAAAASFTSKKLVWESSTCLVLKPNLLMRLFSGTFAFVGGACLIGFLANWEQMVRNSPSIWLFLLVGCGGPAVCLVVGLTMYVGRRIRFDRNEGEMSVRSVWSGWRRPLADIAAVQIISGGRHAFRIQPRGPIYCTYQLNLVFNDAARTRCNLTNEIGADWACRHGHQLARFLNVPFLLQLEGGQPCKPTLRQPLAEELGGRSFTIDAAPLYERDHMSLRYASCIARMDAERLVMRHAVSGCAGCILLVALVPATLFAILLWATEAPPQVFGIVLGVVGTPFLLLAVLVYFGFHRFDKARGLVTFGVLLTRLTRPLADILALQLIPGASSKGQTVYELNMILDDPYEPRLQLARSADNESLRQMGGQVAEFLGMRLLES
jgi:hypothetical protein